MREISKFRTIPLHVRAFLQVLHSLFGQHPSASRVQAAVHASTDVKAMASQLVKVASVPSLIQHRESKIHWLFPIGQQLVIKLRLSIDIGQFVEFLTFKYQRIREQIISISCFSTELITKYFIKLIELLKANVFILLMSSPEERTLMYRIIDQTISEFQISHSVNGLRQILIYQIIKLTSISQIHNKDSTMYSFQFECVRCFDCSPDGQDIAVGYYDSKNIEIYEIEMRAKALIDLVGHDYSVSYVKYSPDGNSILSQSDDGTIKIWDKQTHKELITYSGINLHYIDQITYSPMGNQFATSHESIIRIWNCISESPLKGILLKSIPASFIYNTNGQQLIFTQNQKSSIWNLRRNQSSSQIIGNFNDFLLVQVSINGAFIVYGGFNFIQVRDRRSGKIIRLLDSDPSNKDAYQSVDFIKISPNSQKMISMIQNEVILWDLRNAKYRIIHSANQRQQIWQAQFSPDGRFIVAQTIEEDIMIKKLSYAQFRKN